jgi:hypothetical protein
LDAQSDVLPTVLYLRQVVGLSEKQMRSVVRFAPDVFSYSPVRDFAARLAFLREVVQIPGSALTATVAKRPHILWMDLRSAQAVVDVVAAACPMLSREALGVVFGRVPQALLTSPVAIQDNLEFIGGCIMNPGAMGRIVSKLPLALVFSQKTMKKRVQYLRDALKLPDHVVAKVIVANPDIFQWSIDKCLTPAVDEIAKIVGKEWVPGVITKLPALLGAVDGVQARVTWLMETVGLSEDEVTQVIRKAPAILTYSVAGNLNAKWSFIHNTMGATRDDVLRAPCEIFCASLQQRALPRYAFVMSKFDRDAKPIGVTEILVGSDQEFCRNVVKCDPAEYRRFVDEDRYLFFFSQLV